MRCPVDGRPCAKHRAYSVKIKLKDEEKTHLVCEDCLSLNENAQPTDELGPCTSCGSTLDEVVRTSRLGCSSCYDHFGDPLSYIIASMQFGSATKHVGSVPESFKKSRAESADPIRLAVELEQEMRKATRADDYLKASHLKGFLSELKPILGAAKKGELGPDERTELARIAYNYMYPESA